MNIFINEKEQRLRAGWRLLFQFIIMYLFIGFGRLGFQFVWPGSLGIASSIPQFVAIVASIWVAARLLDKRPFSHYGLSIDKRWAMEFGAGTAIAAVAVAVIFLIEWGAGWFVITGFGWEIPSGTAFGWKLAGYFFAMLMIGFYEELFSRGYQILNLAEGLQYPGIGHRSAVSAALLLTSLLFGLLHSFNPNASAVSTFNIVLAGIVLGLPYILTGSLALSAGLHFSWNFTLGGIAGFPVSGLPFESSLVQINQKGTELWTGGAFGPEAGLLGILGLIIIILLSCVYIKANAYELSAAAKFKKEYQPAGKSDEQTP